MTQLGQHPEPLHSIAHLSDPHFLGGDRLLYGAVDTRKNLENAMAQLEASGARPQAIVFTGDLADLAEPDAYEALKETVEPAAARMGAEVIWVMGNHDERAGYQSSLLGEDPTGEPQDRVHDVGGLRVVVLDSTVPGYHHGALEESQLDWLGEVLAEPAPHGTLLALHHPPLPTPLELMAVLELKRQDRLAEVVRGTDVRGILAGHLHYSTHGTFAGIPVSVSAATCYLLDASSPPHTQIGRSGGQAFTLVHVYADTIVHSLVPVGDFPEVSRFSERFVTKLAAMSEESRLEAFSSKTSTVTMKDVEDS